MKRILFIHHAFARTGACVTLAHVIRALDRSRYEPTVVCPPGDSADMFRDAGARVQISSRPVRMVPHVSGFHFPAWSPHFVAGALGQRLDRGYWRRLIASHAPDLVHLDSLALAPLAAAAREAGVPVVCLVQETFVRGAFGVRSSWLKRVLSTQLDGVWFISEHDRREARTTAAVVEVIPNWSDVSPCVDADVARAGLGLDRDRGVVLFMGGVSRLKGTLTLLRAIDALPAGTVALIAGERFDAMPDDERREVATRLTRLRASGRVRLLGHVTDVAPCYAAADVVVFCPFESHQGRPILEAAAMSRPVIASDFAGVREFVTHGRNGLLVPPGDHRALASSIAALLEDRARASAMGRANRAVSVEKHDPETSRARVNAFYDRVLARA